jgi:hypothetical protein
MSVVSSIENSSGCVCSTRPEHGRGDVDHVVELIADLAL